MPDTGAPLVSGSARVSPTPIQNLLAAVTAGHPGTASMGSLLLLSLGCTLLTSLVFVPALLATMRPSAH